MSELRVQREGDFFYLQQVAEIGWRSWLRCFGLRFLRPKVAWRTMRRVTDTMFPHFSPYGSGYVLKFDTLREAMAQVEKWKLDEEASAIEAKL